MAEKHWYQNHFQIYTSAFFQILCMYNLDITNAWMHQFKSPVHRKIAVMEFECVHSNILVQWINVHQKDNELLILKVKTYKMINMYIFPFTKRTY